MQIYSIYRRATQNIGDLYSSPHHYFDFLRSSVPIDIKEIGTAFATPSSGLQVNLGGAVLILGGGGILDNDFFRDEFSRIADNVTPAQKILWGVGQNQSASNYVRDVYRNRFPDLAGFDLVGLRDYPTPWEWVPCVSCLHRSFSTPIQPAHHDVVSYLHHDSALSDDMKDYLPNIMYNDAPLDEVINHLSSGNLVLTNSYHGAYWAKLLGRKVIAFPTTSKMLHFRFPIPICNPDEWMRYRRFSYICEEALPLSIQANKSFATKVEDRLSIVDARIHNERNPALTANDLLLVQSAVERRDSLEKLNVAEQVRAKLIARLACPKTHGPIDIVPMEMAGKTIKKAILVSRALNSPVGAIDNFQINFVRYYKDVEVRLIVRELKAGQLPLNFSVTQEWDYRRYDNSSIHYSGFTQTIDEEELLCVEGSNASIFFEEKGEIELIFYAHPWSGIVSISYRGQTIEVDLYEPHTTVPRPVRISLGDQSTEVKVTLTGKQNQLAFGKQCLFGGVRVKTNREVPLRFERKSRVRGAAFSQDFYELLERVPANGLLVDVGGGNRQVNDNRYCNLDYAPYLEPDVIGDAMQLPFKANSIDAIYSSGVFEHIQNPIKAGQEVARVLRSGGKALVCWAFMQPIHSEGQHFFNATPWGVRAAFEGLRLNRMWYDTSLSFLVEWAANVSGIAGIIPSEEIASVCSTLREWDTAIPDSHRMFMANAVWCEFEKE